MKESADLSKWTNEDFKKEYELILAKQSKLPAKQRKQIVDLMFVPDNKEKV